jgi:putative MATE family efflux protein
MQLIIIAAFVGLSTGISSAISRKLGAKDHEAAVQVAEHGVLIGVILYIFVAICGFFIAAPLFQGFQIGSFSFNGFTQNQDIIQYGISYVTIVMVFSFGSLFNQAGMSIFRGTGDMIKPMIAQLIGAVLNIILDPILIFGWGFIPAMGVKGAAIATVTAQIIAMIYIWIMLLGGKSIIKLNLKKFKLDMHTIGQIISVGFPSAIMQGLASVMLFAMNFILSRFGDSAIAVMGVYFKIQSMVFMPVFGLAIGTMPVVGFNYGAKNKARIRKAITFSTIVAVCFMSLSMVIFQVFPRGLLSMFSASETMLTIGIPALRTLSLIFPLMAVTIILSTAFQALGKAYYSLVISLVRQLVVLIPSAFILASFMNVDLVWFAFIIAEVIGVTITVITFTTVYKKNIHQWEDVAQEV